MKMRKKKREEEERERTHSRSVWSDSACCCVTYNVYNHTGTRIRYICTGEVHLYVHICLLLPLLCLSLSLIRRYAGEREPLPFMSPHGLILTLVSATPSAAVRLWARRCWYYRIAGNRHSIRRDESILFSAKNKLLVGAYLARSSFRAAYLLSPFISLPLGVTRPSHPSLLSLITFLRGLSET